LLLALASLALAGTLDLTVEAADYDLSAATKQSVVRAAGRIHHLIGTDLGLALPEPTTVHIRTIASRDRYDEEARALGLTKPTLGYFSPRLGKGVVWKNTSTDDFHGTFLHEMTHYLLAVAGAGRVPPWVQEGCAEVMETAQTDGNAVWLRPNPRLVHWLQAHADGLPAASQLLSDGAVWSQLPSTPVGGPEYGIGWSMCAFLLTTPQGKATLSNVIMQTSRGSHRAGHDAVDGTYPRGVSGFDAGWRAWIKAGPSAIQLPIPLEGGPGAGWTECLDGSFVRDGTDQRCGRWVTGDDGWMRYVEDP